MAEVLNSLFQSGEGEIWWHLEPDGYFLSMRSDGEKCEIEFSFATRSKKDKREVLFNYSSEIKDAVLPLWRELRKFYSVSYPEPHWPPEPKREMEILTKNAKVIRSKG